MLLAPSPSDEGKMRRILSYFISKVFLLPASCNLIQNRLWAKIKRRVIFINGPVWEHIDTYRVFIFYIYCRYTKMQYSVCCRGTDKTREKDGLQHIWLTDNTIRSTFYYSAVLCWIVLLRFYFISATPQRINSPVSCSAGREQVKVCTAVCPDNLHADGGPPLAAPIKEQFRWFMQCACAGCSISSHSSLVCFPVWVQLVRMKNQDGGDTNSSCVISWCGFTEVVNPCFALYQPSAGIFSLTGTFCLVGDS